MIGANKDEIGAVDRLQCGRRDAGAGPGGERLGVNRDEHARTQAFAGIVDDDPRPARACAFAELRADEGDLADDFGAAVARIDPDGTSGPQPVEIGTVDGCIDPDCGRIGNDEGRRLGAFLDHLAQHGMALDDGTGDRCRKGVACEGLIGSRDKGVARRLVNAQRLQLLAGTAHLNAGFLQRLTGVEEVLLRRDLLLPQPPLALETRLGEIKAGQGGQVCGLGVGQGATVEHGEELAGFDRVTLGDMNGMNDTRYARRDMGQPRLVETNLGGQFHLAVDRTGIGPADHYAQRVDVAVGQFYVSGAIGVIIPRTTGLGRALMRLRARRSFAGGRLRRRFRTGGQQRQRRRAGEERPGECRYHGLASAPAMPASCFRRGAPKSTSSSMAARASSARASIAWMRVSK